MRWVVLLCFVACDFTHGISPPDDSKRPDTPPDIPSSVTWTVDPTSGKSVPSSAVEWADFIGAHQLQIAPPNGLWLMQETASPLHDAIGTADLPSAGNDAPLYQQAVAGWSRRAVRSADGSGVVFFNNSDASLPNVSTASMTVLMLYATQSVPGAARSVLVAGCCTGYAAISIDPAAHYKLSVNTTGSATGGMDHGSEVIPIVLKLDHTNARQVVITNRETIAPPNTQLAPYKGLYLGAANGGAPDGRWLYMAAWYATSAEMTDAQISALITALGW